MSTPPINHDQGFDWDHPLVKLVIERVTGINRKVTPQDCEASRTLREVADYYAANYSGSFDFMVKMREAIERWHTLRPAQASGAINSMMAEYRFRAERAKQEAAKADRARAMLNDPLPMPEPMTYNAFKAAAMKDPALLDKITAATSEIAARGGDDRDMTIPAVSLAHASANDEPITRVCHNATFTVVLDETGAYRTLKLTDCPDHMGKPSGTQIASFLSGADNESNYTGFAFVFGSRFAVWSKFKADSKLALALKKLLAADRDAQIEFGHAYAIESGNCSRCGRKLTVPASIHRGLGPKCAEMI